MSVWRKLSVPKILTTICLLTLGLNGLLQVGLQRDMASQAVQLKQQLAQTETLSGQMKTGLNGLADVRDTSVHMQQSLVLLQQSTSDMNKGMATLEQSVTGLDGTIQSLGQSTNQSDGKIVATAKTANDLLTLLQQINGVNDSVIENLNGMIQDQQAINANLAAMNRKTQVLPRWGGQ